MRYVVVCGMWNVVYDMLVCGMWYVGMWVCDMLICWYVACGIWNVICDMCVCDMWYVDVDMLVWWQVLKMWMFLSIFWVKGYSHNQGIPKGNNIPRLKSFFYKENDLSQFWLCIPCYFS